MYWLQHAIARFLEAGSHEISLEKDGGSAEGELGQLQHNATLDDEVDALSTQLALVHD